MRRRFGYLRSNFPADASSEAQADAFVDLLDHLKIDRIAVIGGSAGALSALQFAIRHPERCSALVLLVPAAFDPNRALENVELGPLSETIIRYGLRSDFLYWLGITLAPHLMIRTLLATDPSLVDRADPNEQERAKRILWNILPVSARAMGFLNDAKLAGSPQPITLAKIRAPTLAISLEDDHFGTLAPARHIAASVADSRLVSYPTGGHIWIGHDADVFREIDLFLRGGET
jgi:2-hydroxy-6-oxonona-2,4-dienedioate hydrolase